MTSNDDRDAMRRDLYLKVGWRLIPLLIIVYAAAFIDRSNIAFAKLTFMKDVGVDEAAYGLGGGLFYLGYCLFEVPSNLLLARIGAKRTLMRIMILWSLFSAGFAFIAQPWHFFGLRFMLGAAEAGLFPGVLFYLSQWAPAKRRARFTALFMSAMALSGVVTGPISGAIMAKTDGLAGLHAWQWLFLLEGLPGVILAVVLYFCLTDAPSQAIWLNADEKAQIEADLAADVSAKSATAHGGAWYTALTDKRFWGLALMAAALIGTINGISLWTPTVIKLSGLKDVLQISLLSSVPYVVAVIVQQLVARHSDKRQERLWHVVIPAFVAACAWTALAMPQIAASPVAAMITLCIVAGGTFGATGPFWSTPAQIFTGKASAGGIAMVTTVGSISGFICPVVVGWLNKQTESQAAGQYFYAALMVVAAVGLAALLGAPSRPRNAAGAGA